MLINKLISRLCKEKKAHKFHKIFVYKLIGMPLRYYNAYFKDINFNIWAHFSAEYVCICTCECIYEYIYEYVYNI